MLWVGLVQARDYHIPESNAGPMYYCNIGASQSWVHTIRMYNTRPILL